MPSGLGPGYDCTAGVYLAGLRKKAERQRWREEHPFTRSDAGIDADMQSRRIAENAALQRSSDSKRPGGVERRLHDE